MVKYIINPGLKNYKRLVATAKGVTRKGQNVLGEV